MSVQPVGESSTRAPEPVSTAYAPFPRRGLVVGLAACPLVVFWGEYTEIISRGADLIAMSLIMSVLCLFLALLGINALLNRFAPKLAFSRADLLMIYIINSASIGLSGLGMMQFLTNVLAGSIYYRREHAEWGTWVHMLRPWALPTEDVVTPYYEGHASFFDPNIYLGWIQPIAVWSFFLITLLGCFYCLATLLRRQWMDAEQLQFPIAVIPLEIMKDTDRPIWRDGIMWAGFGTAFVLETFAVIHYSFTVTFPYFPIKPSEPIYNLNQFMTAPPWSGMGNMQASMYPLVIGLTFLLSLEISFSCWFFYLVSRLENVAATFYGFRMPDDHSLLGTAPYIGDQGAGAFLMLAVLALVGAWPHFKSAFRHAFLSRGRASGVTDADEPLSYRAAFIGFLFTAVALVAFAAALGVAVQVGVAFVGLLLLFTIVTTRIRAEAGLPWSAAPATMAHGALIDIPGSHAFAPQTLVGFGLLQWFDSDARTIMMPYHAEAMKIARDGKLNPRHLTWGVALGTIVAIAASWVSILGLYYHYGAVTTDAWRVGQGEWQFGSVNNWVTSPKGLNSSALAAVIVGAGVTGLLAVLRRSVLWWPFHPIGFAVANTDALSWLWLPIMVGWFCKHAVLRYGGTKGYRRFLPFFIGLVLGDYTAGGAWSLCFLFAHIPGYRTFPW
jgi:hypothetical protein